VEVEVMPPDQDQQQHQSQVRLTHVRALGVIGTLLALLTMAAAFGVGFVAFFGTSLLASAVVALAWPRIFSPDFTQWVFGTPRVEYWKLFLLFLVAGMVVKLLGVRRK
jgi:hypothetical protein